MAQSKHQLTKEQLANLTKEQKLQLLDIIDEKKRRAKAARKAFVPHEGQMRLINSKAKIRINVCGNGFGKTAHGVNEAHWAALGYNPILKTYNPVPADVIVVLDAPSKVADVWLPEIKKWYPLTEDQLHKDGKPFVSRITFPNGSQIRFMFWLQEAMAFESVEADFVVFDEPPPRSVFVALLRAGRKKDRQARYLILGTPIAQDWLREYHAEWRKGQHADTEFFRMSSEMNRANLSDGYIEGFTAHLTDRERRTRIDGEFFATDGLALAGLFRSEKHVISPSKLPPEWKSWPAVIAVDPHPQKPTHACVLLASPQGKWIYVAERAVKELPRDWAKWVRKNWMQEYNVVDLVCDNFGSGEFTGGDGFKSFIEVCRSEGVALRPTSYDEKKDDDFIERLQEALLIPDGGEPKLQILGSCQGLVNDVLNVGWQAIKGSETYKPKLEISNRDFLACLKYALATNLTFDNSKRRVIRPPGVSQKPKKMGYVEERWARGPAYQDDDDW
jgi:hypothetical protein